MTAFFVLIKDYFNGIANVLHLAKFNIGGLNVSFFELILGFIVLGFIISVFWKGARS